MSEPQTLETSVVSSQETVETHVESVGDLAMPVLGFGTFQTGGHECYRAVTEALRAGYRHIDTAMAYENEAAIGQAIDDVDIDRSDLFLTTKAKGYAHILEPGRLREAVFDSLDLLGTDYIDLYLIHWWNPESDMEAVMSVLGEFVEEGRINHIGVSNFSVDQLAAAAEASPVPILTNQVQYHPYFDQRELLSYCREHDIILTAYSPLGVGRVIDDPVLTSIGEQYDKTAAQVAIRWLIQQENVVTIPKSVTNQYIRENRDVFDFELTQAEMQAIHDLDGPLWYRLNNDRGAITRARSSLGGLIPADIREQLPTS